jgi:hypothetical protein
MFGVGVGSSHDCWLRTNGGTDSDAHADTYPYADTNSYTHTFTASHGRGV